jgi:hypothetical protein
MPPALLFSLVSNDTLSPVPASVAAFRLGIKELARVRTQIGDIDKAALFVGGTLVRLEAVLDFAAHGANVPC